MTYYDKNSLYLLVFLLTLLLHSCGDSSHENWETRDETATDSISPPIENSGGGPYQEENWGTDDEVAFDSISPPTENSNGQGRGPASLPLATRSIADRISELERGKLEYSFPRSMQVGEPSEIEVAIGRDTTAIMLEENDDVEAEEDRDAIIPIAEFMTVQLVGDTSLFHISKTVSHDDPIPIYGSGRWVFTVVPKVAGRHSLYLNVYVSLEGEAAKVEEVYPIYEAKLEVKTNRCRDAKEFIKAHWKWLIVVIFIPFLGWAWKEWKERRA